MAQDKRDPHAPALTGEAPLIDGPQPQVEEPERAARRPGAAAVAARLLRALDPKTPLTVLVTTSERRADEIGRALSAFAGDRPLRTLILPPWDCLPYDRASPSRESMGRRMAVFEQLARDAAGSVVLVSSPDALMQRIPPRAVLAERFEIETGAPLDRDALSAFAHRAGYVQDDRIDEPGEIAILGEVVDVYPPSSATPLRIAIDEDGRVADIRRYDPVTQRSDDSVERLCLTPASELLIGPEDVRTPGEEHRMAERYSGGLESLLDLLSGACILTEDEVEDRCRRFADQTAEAHQTRLAFRDEDARPLPPEQSYLSLEETLAFLDQGQRLDLDGLSGNPSFAVERSPGKALASFIQERRDAGRRVVLAGLAHEHRMVARLLRRAKAEAPETAASWDALLEAPHGAFVALPLDLDVGFDDAELGVTVITPTDAVGGRVARPASGTAELLGEPELRAGDVVIHEDHGVGVLQALERIAVGDQERDVLRLEYHGGATVLAPVEEFGRIWRYGSEPSAVTLDRLNTDAWLKRRAQLSADIDMTARQLVEMAKAREEATAEPIRPPKPALARFAAGFPYPESVDQAAAIEAVLDDLASGRPMNRLVCGDVGFGKTEVALRATAAAALAGKQVIVSAPTTVLARQHFETFQRRFAGTDVVVAQLSRLVDSKEAKAVKAGLASGEITVAVGTHALGADDVTLAEPGLVIIDEEQRFGAAMKDKLCAKAPHLLSLTATPIPRTLQGALVGIQDVSVIASPPARRRPIRTFLTPFDAASVRTALLREKARGGQSFVVVPRIEDLEPMQARLAEIAGELSVRTAHGKLSAEETDAVMVGFADGEGDVLLATNIIESGLDVPSANTMIVWRPDRFGLAQLHQLRGRVGRGRRQGFAYLLHAEDEELPEATRARLSTLEALDRLGSGFAISARDLDLRGGGDLVGDEQAGHMRMIGASLYQRVLEGALRTARGERPLNLGEPIYSGDPKAALPEDYIPDPTTRINLYARLARLSTTAEIEAFGDELEDRFGPLPDPAAALIANARLNALAHEAGVEAIASGPKATAFSFGRAAASVSKRIKDDDARHWKDDRLIYPAGDTPHDSAFIESVLTDLAA